MDANVKKILSDLKAGKYAPVYFLQGEETFYIDLISDYIEKNALSEAEKGFNQVVVYGKDATMATILTHARRFPMMAQRQVVIVRRLRTSRIWGRISVRSCCWTTLLKQFQARCWC